MRLLVIFQSVLIVLLVACAGTASAALVAEHAGPTEFEPTTIPFLPLPEVTVGDEGTVMFEFKAKETSIPGVLWYNAEAWTPVLGEQRIYLGKYGLNVIWWDYEGGYVGAWSTPFTDYTEWHGLQVAWKNGEDMVVTFDGVTETVALTAPLHDFTSGTGCHTIGAYPDGGLCFNGGEMRNVKVYNHYIPEPGGLVMVLTIAAGLLLCVRRKQRGG